MTHPKPNPAPVVTRADREAAFAALYPSGKAPTFSDWTEQWRDTGLTPPGFSMDREERIALAIATAREAGKLEERARCVEYLWTHPVDLCNEGARGIEAGEHEGAGDE